MFIDALLLPSSESDHCPEYLHLLRQALVNAFPPFVVQ